jgi:queuosine precursor transporter
MALSSMIRPVHALPVLAMVVVVAGSNVAVQYPINDWLTWGAFTYPVAFLVTDLTNRRLGPGQARRVAYIGFALGVLLSIVVAGPRIAVASGAAFLTAQLLDIAVFDRLRRLPWWQAPLVSSGLASVWDTALFFTLAFAGTGLPWTTWALGDLGAKAAMALLLLLPFRALMGPTDAAATAAPAR